MYSLGPEGKVTVLLVPVAGFQYLSIPSMYVSNVMRTVSWGKMLPSNSKVTVLVSLTTLPCSGPDIISVSRMNPAAVFCGGWYVVDVDVEGCWVEGLERDSVGKGLRSGIAKLMSFKTSPPTLKIPIMSTIRKGIRMAGISLM